MGEVDAALGDHGRLLPVAWAGGPTSYSSSQFAGFFRLGCTRGGSPGIFGVPTAQALCE